MGVVTMKMNLPVILLRGSSFLPYTELKLEIDNEESQDIINTATFFHNNYILVATKKNDGPQLLPKMGVISKITEKKMLPNGHMHIVIVGKERATILDYLTEENEVLETIVEENKRIPLRPAVEKQLVQKIRYEIETYTKEVPSASDAIMNQIQTLESLDTILDIATVQLLSSTDTEKYLEESNPEKRMQLLLQDMAKEKEKAYIEGHLAYQLEKELEDTQKEYMIKEKIRLLQEEIGETDTKTEELLAFEKRMEQVNLPQTIYNKVQKEMNRYQSLPSISPELSITAQYIDTLLSMPWNQYTQDNEVLEDVKNKLNQTHYDLERIKNRIIQFLASKQRNPSLKSPILCLVGPSGVGKTSLAFSIAEALGRNFVKMSVGGMTDEGEIVGHRRTYMGARPGRIIQLLKKAQSMNPVFLIDEIDKMVKGYKGDPISALLDVLDPTQNQYFTDHYMEEEIDLSSVFFITTANSVESIPEEIKDRLEIIEIEGYTEYEKVEIAQNYLLPLICENYGFTKNSFTFTEEALVMIIRYYTKEAGVRELERKLSEVVRFIVTDMVLYKAGKNKYRIMEKDIETYLGKSPYPKEKYRERKQVGIAIGLGYTAYGGKVFPIEVSYYKGSGKFLLTGSLGETIKESALLALSYLKKHAREFHLDYQVLCTSDIHIHIPEGHVFKDGPSAGIAITTALLSAFSKKKISNYWAMTGEMTLTGQILPVGKIKQKVLAAYQEGLTKIYLPSFHQKEMEELPMKIQESIQFVFVRTYKDVYQDWIGSDKPHKPHSTLQKSA